jgi:hypothetical protein
MCLPVSDFSSQDLVKASQQCTKGVNGASMMDDLFSPMKKPG